MRRLRSAVGCAAGYPRLAAAWCLLAGAAPLVLAEGAARADASVPQPGGTRAAPPADGNTARPRGTQSGAQEAVKPAGDHQQPGDRPRLPRRTVGKMPMPHATELGALHLHPHAPHERCLALDAEEVV